MAPRSQLPWSPYITLFARASLYLLFISVVYWTSVHLGGWSSKPTPIDETSNNTTLLFNWHPVLMVLGVVMIGEALLAYKSPWTSLSRDQSKLVHASLHCLAFVSLSIGLAVAFKSHSLKKPSPFPDLYSVHSYIGLSAFIVGGLQLVIGFSAYLWPKLSLPIRQNLSPNHIFWGKTSFVLFLGAILTGLQEKATFIQFTTQPKPDVFSPVLRFPAVLAFLTVVAGASIMYIHSAKQQLVKPQEDPTADEALLQDRDDDQL